MRNKPYRTKMEYAIYVDANEVLHLAQHIPGTRHGLVPTDVGSELALPKLNEAALHIIKILNQKGIENPHVESRISKKQLKGIMVRYSIFERKSVCYLYIKDEDLNLQAGDFFDSALMKGLFVYYSTKKSPAYVQTKLVSSIGERDLIEQLNGKKYKFPSDGFFQINIPIVEEFLKDAYEHVSKLPNQNREVLLDLYAGVGTIGIYFGDLFKKIIGVEYFPGSKSYALANAKNNEVESYDFIESRSEDADLSRLLNNRTTLFLDPPRAGCMPQVVNEILQSQPEYIFYLSCNPETQERDVQLLSSKYKIIHSKDYDFFPNTTHLERFVILRII